MFKIISIFISVMALVVIIGSSLMVFLGKLTLDVYKTWTLLASIIWFVVSPFWMIKKKAVSEGGLN